jgi:hypothetical protein
MNFYVEDFCHPMGWNQFRYIGMNGCYGFVMSISQGK